MEEHVERKKAPPRPRNGSRRGFFHVKTPEIRMKVACKQKKPLSGPEMGLERGFFHLQNKILEHAVDVFSLIAAFVLKICQFSLQIGDLGHYPRV